MENLIIVASFLGMMGLMSATGLISSEVLDKANCVSDTSEYRSGSNKFNISKNEEVLK
ncbi:hypothetical protein [Breznakia pachnodae]|uniref:NADH dehydrogenase subunit 3 n=1 Tax=Breznakia pachnodae TaxID=265178 RepID=A0ABU0E3Z9_9FIRM|nr:hypothetical protein [Breznakia pachnodae]MDQ0361623.1 hypothetical protein [Breznakia pachnodae]